jgi:hypothetical protein
MSSIDEIILGPVTLMLAAAADGTLCIFVRTRTAGGIGMGVPTTEDEWRELRRHVGLEGALDQ